MVQDLYAYKTILFMLQPVSFNSILFNYQIQNTRTTKQLQDTTPILLVCLPGLVQLLCLGTYFTSATVFAMNVCTFDCSMMSVQKRVFHMAHSL